MPVMEWNSVPTGRLESPSTDSQPHEQIAADRSLATVNTTAPQGASTDDPHADTGTDAIMGLLRRWASSVSIWRRFGWELGSGLVDEGVQLVDESEHAELRGGSAAGGQQRLGALVFAALDQRSCPPVAGACGERR